MHRFLSVLLFLSMLAFSQQENWRKPYPAHKIAGNLYYVGTDDLACFLITTPEGHILINTGLADSVPLIRDGIEKLGFQLKDLKILLTMQAHYDHVAGIAELKKLTGAKLYVTEADVAAVEDGGKGDPYLSERYRYTPAKVDRKLKDGDAIRLGGSELKVILTPGHTKGSVTYAMTVNDNGTQRKVLIANMSTVVMPLVGNSFYPRIIEDYEKSFRVQKGLSADIWVAGHASQYGMQAKHKAGSFVDPEGYRKAVANYEQQYRKKLAEERKQ